MSLWASLAPPVGHMALRLCRLPDQSGSKVAARLEGLCVLLTRFGHRPLAICAAHIVAPLTSFVWSTFLFPEVGAVCGKAARTVLGGGVR